MNHANVVIFILFYLPDKKEDLMYFILYFKFSWRHHSFFVKETKPGSYLLCQL